MEFFAGIFDDLRGVVDSVDGFFDTSIGKAVGAAGKTYAKTETENKQRTLEASKISQYISRESFQPTRDLGYEDSEDFSRIEVEWLERMRRLKSLTNETEVK